MSTSTDADFVPAVIALGFHLATAVSLLVAVAARQWLLCGAVVAIAAVAFVVTQFVQFVPKATAEQTQLQQFQIQNQQMQQQMQTQAQMSAEQGNADDASSQTQQQATTAPQGVQGSTPLAAQGAFDQSVQQALQAVAGHRVDLDAQLQFEIDRMALLSTQFQREQDISYWNT